MLLKNYLYRRIWLKFIACLKIHKLWILSLYVDWLNWLIFQNKNRIRELWKNSRYKIIIKTNFRNIMRLKMPICSYGCKNIKKTFMTMLRKEGKSYYHLHHIKLNLSYFKCLLLWEFFKRKGFHTEISNHKIFSVIKVVTFFVTLMRQF